MPFDQERERRDPWWGDPSSRVIPLGTTERDVRLYHLHIDPRFGEADLDVVLPMRRLTELAQEGLTGQPAPRHYSIMGYILEPTCSSGNGASDRRGNAVRRRRRGRTGAGVTAAAGPWDWCSACSRRAASRPFRCR